MTDFKDGDLSYCIDFKIITHEIMEKVDIFDAKRINTDSFQSTDVYKTKNEAIDATIKKLEELKV